MYGIIEGCTVYYRSIDLYAKITLVDDVRNHVEGYWYKKGREQGSYTQRCATPEFLEIIKYPNAALNIFLGDNI